MINIYEYQNYRTYLQDYFKEEKERNPRFSHRAVLMKMGISSTGFLANVMSGKSNLTNAHIARLGKILKLSARDTQYFENLVHFTQSKTIEEKNEYYERISASQKYKLKVLSKKQLCLYEEWYYSVIRELLYFIEFKNDFCALAKMVDPPIRAQEAKKAIETLNKLGLIKKDTKGVYKQTDAVVTSGDEVDSFHVANFQLSTMDYAKRALEKVKGKDRDISVVTMTLSEESFLKIKQEIQEFRKKLCRIAEMESAPDQVFQLNINLFPVTKRKEK